MTEANTDRSAALTAELWFADAPDLSDPRLLEALRTVSPDAQPQAESLSVPHPGLVTGQVNGSGTPLVTVVMAGSPLGREGKAPPDPSQTWDWAEAESAVQRCRASVLVTEMFADRSSGRQRLDALTAVVAALIPPMRPVALSWPHSQRLVDPEVFAAGEIEDMINVRFFAVGDSGHEMVMDTLGLSLFGLPDVQCHYRDANPADIGALMWSVGRYTFANGDVIADGHTISGPRGDEHFVCRHETSLLPPRREVIDIDLGPPYAAGTRGSRGS